MAREDGVLLAVGTEEGMELTEEGHWEENIRL